MYLVSSSTGTRHLVDGDMPDNDTALRMWKGLEKPVTRCGRALTPVNFYQPDEPGSARFRCYLCFRKGDERS
jgi:hypothetical protein